MTTEPATNSTQNNFAALIPQSRHGIVTALTMMKDEGPFLLEWIAHHLAVGFSRIVVYTNDCSDGTDQMLIRLEELGLAHHRQNVIPSGRKPQPSALKYAQNEPLVATSDWLLLLDADEFLAIKYGDGTLNDLLDATIAQGANGIVITWRVFGSGGVHDWSRAPVTEQYLMAAPPDWNKGWGVKTLFKFDPKHWKLGIHRPKIKNKWLETSFPDTVKWLNGSGQPMENYFKFRGWRSIVRTIGYDWAQMNHYAVKSIDSYAIRKFRGNVNLKKDKYNGDYWALQDRNEVFDKTILRHSKKRMHIFEQLLTDPVLRQLHFTALEMAEAKLAEFRLTDAYQQMVNELKTAAQIPIAQVSATPPKPRDPAKIAALMSRVEKAQSEDQRAMRRASRGKTPKIEPIFPVLIQAENADSVQSPNIALSNNANTLFSNTQEISATDVHAMAVARMLPQVLSTTTRLLELGAGSGLRSAYLFKEMSVLSQVVQEEREEEIKRLEIVWAQNGVQQGSRLRLLHTPLSGEALATLFAEFKPQSLLISDISFSPEGILKACKASDCWPTTLILVGPALSHGDHWRKILCALPVTFADEAHPEFLTAQITWEKQSLIDHSTRS